MTTTKLKNIISKKISKIDDLEFLNAINLILESRDNSKQIYKLNDMQRKKVKKSKLQFKEGKRISNGKVFDEIEQWLKEQ